MMFLDDTGCLSALVATAFFLMARYWCGLFCYRQVAELTDERNWRSGLRVRLLVRRQVSIVAL